MTNGRPPASHVELVAQARAARNAAELLRATTLTATAARRLDDLHRQLDRLVRDLEDTAAATAARRPS